MRRCGDPDFPDSVQRLRSQMVWAYARTGLGARQLVAGRRPAPTARVCAGRAEARSRHPAWLRPFSARQAESAIRRQVRGVPALVFSLAISFHKFLFCGADLRRQGFPARCLGAAKPFSLSLHWHLALLASRNSCATYRIRPFAELRGCRPGSRSRLAREPLQEPIPDLSRILGRLSALPLSFPPDAAEWRRKPATWRSCLANDGSRGRRTCNSDPKAGIRLHDP